MKTVILRVSCMCIFFFFFLRCCIYLYWICISDQTIIAHHSTVEAKTQTSTAQNGYICKDSSNASPSKSNCSLHDATGHQSFTKTPSTASFPNTMLYCRDKNRKYKQVRQFIMHYKAAVNDKHLT